MATCKQTQLAPNRTSLHKDAALATIWDVIVVGGGTSGCAAAIASARVGANTLLIERLGVLGGEMNVSGPPGFAYAYLFNQRREQVVGGIVDETYKRLLADGHALPHINPSWRGSYILSYVDPDWWGFLMFTMMEESNVKLLLHSLVVDVIEDDGSVNGVVVETVSGRLVLRGKTIVDCTGTGEVALKAGARSESPAPEELQPHSLGFTVDGVAWDRALLYIKQNFCEFDWERFYDNDWEVVTEVELREAVNSAHSIVELGEIMGYFTLRDAAYARGEWHGFSGVGFFLQPREGGVIQAHFQHSSQVPFCDATDVFELTRGEVECRRQNVVAWRFIKRYMPGFENAYVCRVCAEMRIRESRRIVGDYVLSGDDIVEGRRFEDVIGRSAFPAGRRHVASGQTLEKGGGRVGYPKGGGSHDIPYRCLVPVGVENLLVGGRAVSTDRDGYLRLIQQTMTTGQAAGVAAALCGKRGLTPRELEGDVKELQEILVGQGAILSGTH